MSSIYVRPVAGCVAALMLASLAGPALAQADPQAPVTKVGKKLPRERIGEVFEKRFFEKVDTDRDNVITREEFRRQADERFDALDVNRDGKLTRDEIHEKVKGRKHKSRAG